MSMARMQAHTVMAVPTHKPHSQLLFTSQSGHMAQDGLPWPSLVSSTIDTTTHIARIESLSDRGQAHHDAELSLYKPCRRSQRPSCLLRAFSLDKRKRSC